LNVWKKALLLIHLALVCGTISCTSTKKAAVSADAIDALFQEYNQPNVPGAAVMIIQEGKIALSRSYGFANLEERRPVTSATNFRLASVTKQFTAMAVLILAEQKKLSLDDPLVKFFPDLPPSDRAIKIRHLLNHTSGIVDYESLMPDSQTVQILDKEVLQLLKKADSTYFPAGSKFQYSNSAYSLLSLVVELVSHRPFAQFLKENIFLPLSMTNTVTREAGTVVTDRAYGYSRTNAGFVFTDQSSTSAVLGDGGIYSSVDDLFKWDQALYTEKLASKATLDLALNPTTATDTTAFQYGYGWFIGEYHGLRTVHHTGTSRGLRNAILRLPDQRFSVIILTNRNEGAPVEKARKIVDLYFKK
jgi:CubicO group peptidase (beta-lactamase class C family)